MSAKYSDSDKEAFTRISEALINWRDATIDLAAVVSEAKEREIWKLKYDSWNDFCQIECGITKQWANKLVLATKTMKEIADYSPPKVLQIRETTGNDFPPDEKKHLSVEAAAELAKIKPEIRREVLKQTAASGPVTAKRITSTAAAQPSPIQDVVELDRTGLPVPYDLLPLWRRASEVQKHLTQLSDLRGTLRAAQEARDLLWGGLSYSGALADAGKLYTSIECAKPYAVCPKCQGKVRERCVICKGRGLVSQYLWDSAISREDKAMRAKVVEKLKETK